MSRELGNATFGNITVNGTATLGSLGGLPTNYFDNPDFETDNTGATAAGGTPPTLGAETISPLFGARSLKITSGAGTGYVDIAISGIDSAVIDGGILLGLTAYLKTDAAVAEGDWTAGIFNTTDASYEGSVPQTDLKADLLNVFRGVFVPVTGKTYVLRVEFTDTTAGRILIADGLKLTPDSSTAIQAFEQKTVTVDNTVLNITGTGGTTITGVPSANAYSYRDANGVYWFTFQAHMQKSNIDLICDFSMTGIAIAAGNPQYQAFYNDGSVSGGPTLFARFEAGSDTFVIRMTGGTAGEVRCGGTIRIDKPTWFDANLDDNKINLITPNLLTSNSRAHFRRSNTSAAITNGNPLPVFVLSGIEAFNIGGGFTVISDTIIEMNFTGYVSVSGVVSFGTLVSAWLVSMFNLTAGTSVFLGADKTDTIILGAGGCANVTVPVTKGDQISFLTLDGPSLALDANTWFDFVRVADIGAHEAVGFGLAKSSPAQAGLLDLSASSTQLATATTPGLLDLSASSTQLATATTPGLVFTGVKSAFYGTLSGGQAITPGDTKINIQVGDDANGDFNNGTSEFTAPVTGFYNFSGCYMFTGNATDNVTYGIKFAGTIGEIGRHMAVYGSDGGNEEKGNSLAATIFMTVGQTIGLYYVGDNTGTLNASGGRTFFSGHLVSAKV